MRVPHWIGLSLFAACAHACAGASDNDSADESGTPADPQSATSQCADAGAGSSGAQDGDRLEQINGYDVADPDAALEAFSRLRTASELTVGVERRGCPTTLPIHIE